MTIKVTRDALEAIRRAAGAAHPLEACGLLLGETSADVPTISRVIPARNVHPTPATHFEIDPKVLIDAYRDERGGGAALIGYFHSHPQGSPEPSATDQRISPRDGRVWAITTGDETRFWRDDPGGFAAMDSQIIDPR